MSSPLSGAKNPKIKKNKQKKSIQIKSRKNTTKINSPPQKKNKKGEKNPAKIPNPKQQQNITEQEETNKILQITAFPINTLQNENKSHGSNNPDGNQSMMLSAGHHL